MLLLKELLRFGGIRLGGKLGFGGLHRIGSRDLDYMRLFRGFRLSMRRRILDYRLRLLLLRVGNAEHGAAQLGYGALLLLLRVYLRLYFLYFVLLHVELLRGYAVLLAYAVVVLDRLILRIADWLHHAVGEVRNRDPGAEKHADQDQNYNEYRSSQPAQQKQQAADEQRKHAASAELLAVFVKIRDHFAEILARNGSDGENLHRRAQQENASNAFEHVHAELVTFLERGKTYRNKNKKGSDQESGVTEQPMHYVEKSAPALAFPGGNNRGERQDDPDCEHYHRCDVTSAHAGFQSLLAEPELLSLESLL